MAKFVEPQVELIGMPAINYEGMKNYLDYVGGTSWLNKRIPPGNPIVSTEKGTENLIEFMGRNCYRSWEPQLNPNVTKVREDQTDYLQNIMKSQHGSVLEHANLNFIIYNVSRVFTHEMVRHRAGVAISQESLRFVRLTDIDVIAPPEFQDEEFISIVEKLEEYQKNKSEEFGLDEEGTPFHYKKKVTSALRRLAPIGVSTNMGWTANIRTLRHVITMRTAPGAEWEIRLVFSKIANIVSQQAPALFEDFTATENEDGIPSWAPEWGKV